jgi:hypothetical protein
MGCGEDAPAWQVSRMQAIADQVLQETDAPQRTRTVSADPAMHFGFVVWRLAVSFGTSVLGGMLGWRAAC